MKKATRLTGLPVCENPRYVLNLLYGKILRALDKLPKESAYRRYTEEIVANRASIVNSAESMCEIEQKLKSGEAEELVLQAEKELRLARNFSYSKPWKPLIAEAPEGQWKWPPSRIS